MQLLLYDKPCVQQSRCDYRQGLAYKIWNLEDKPVHSYCMICTFKVLKLTKCNTGLSSRINFFCRVLRIIISNLLNSMAYRKAAGASWYLGILGVSWIDRIFLGFVRSHAGADLIQFFSGACI